METRLQLRRRLLLVDASRRSSSSLPEETNGESASTLAYATSLLHVSQPASRRALLRQRVDYRTQQRTRQEQPQMDDDEPADEEPDDDDEEQEDEEDSLASGDGNGGAETNAPRTNEKCETSPVVKLLFSRHDLARSPTICFDYPPHLNTTRDYQVQSSGAMHRVVVLNAQDCPLYYKTHWERNCVKNAFAVAGLLRTKKKWTGWHIAWAKHIPKTNFKFFKDSQHAQVFNHFPDPWVIGRKDRLMRTLASYKRRFGASYNFFPEGFTLPDQMDAFRRAIQREDAALSVSESIPRSKLASSSSSSSIWILKPPASACGRGIRVITSKDVDSISKDRKYVVQKYLSNPLLMDGYKFDLRIYTVVTSVDPLRIYLFQEGIARFCTSKYSLAKLKNRFSHLTNYSVNKTNDHFVENTDAEQGNAGSKWSLTGLLAHLHSLNILKDPEQLKAQIREIICKTIIAAETHLTPLTHQFVKKPITCYELFGFDIMLDSNLKPWLIEVNVSPSLMGGSPLDKRVKGLLLSDIFHLVGVPVHLANLPAGVLPRDLEQRLAPQDAASSTAPTALNRRLSSAVQSGSRRNSSTSSAASSRTINKQLHEIVLDPNIPCFENNHLELFSPSDWDIIHQMEDEMDRLGHFDRIYPSTDPDETAKYAPFFTCQRYSNALCAKWINSLQSKSRRRQKPKRQSARK